MVEGLVDRQARLDARWNVRPIFLASSLAAAYEVMRHSPHDIYGMTSLSVRGYTTGIYRKLGLKEEEITKVQTGGPDGDLGSSALSSLDGVQSGS